jgi:hypothetical protein
MDVIAGGVGDVETETVSNTERDRFGFEFPRVTRVGTLVAVVQQFVRLGDPPHKRIYVRQLVMFAARRSRFDQRASMPTVVVKRTEAPPRISGHIRRKRPSGVGTRPK